jgi:predicted nucleic acid-binding protein
VRRYDWQHLFKANSALVKQIAVDLDQMRLLMRMGNLILLQPDDLGPIPSGRTLDDELVRTMERYELDSNDAAILLEARRAGIAAVASSDADFQRAQLDFDVYTWH